MLIAALLIFLNIPFLFFNVCFFIIFSIFVYYRKWNIVPYAIYTVGPCCLSILYIYNILHLLSLPTPLATTSMFSVSESVSVLFTG